MISNRLPGEGPACLASPWPALCLKELHHLGALDDYEGLSLWLGWLEG